jgi:hypothetical protein
LLSLESSLHAILSFEKFVTQMSPAISQTLFQSREITCCGGDVPWPARSPDLSACDYFLWGFLKSRVFISKPTTTAELKQSINEEIAAIPILVG